MSGGRERPLPAAILRPRRRVSAAWLIPLAALALAAWLGFRAWSARGVVVTVLLPEGHGLKTGDDVRYHGITVGTIRSVELTGDLEIRVTASLGTESGRLARQGSRFWVVRPQLQLSRIAGIETLLGPRYLAVLPGRGPRRRSFIGLPEPPAVEAQEPGDLEIILAAVEQGNLHRGAPVTYRQVQVGTVLSVGLASDGGAVEARVHIEKAYAQLVRQRSRFWDAGGVEASVGLTGLSFKLKSLESVLAGGIAMATPPDAGEPVRNGHRFALEQSAPEDWLQWHPMAVIGSSMLPPGAALPAPLRARAGWKQGWWITRNRSRQGWILQMPDGLLGPADVLRPQPGAGEKPAIEVAGTTLPPDAAIAWESGGLALLSATVNGAPWPRSRCRRPSAEPEDCLAVADPTAMPLPLAAARLEPHGDGWLLDAALSVDESWHGAAVVARADGALVGLLLVEDGSARVAPMPEEAISH